MRFSCSLNTKRTKELSDNFDDFFFSGFTTCFFGEGFKGYDFDYKQNEITRYQKIFYLTISHAIFPNENGSQQTRNMIILSINVILDFMKYIFLVGFMGSGKTTFGKKLAARMKHSFTDLDAAVSQRYSKKDVSELIEEKGFDFFRQAEQDCLKNLSGERLMIATGGGTPCYFDNLLWMKQNGVVVFLNPGIEVIYSRLLTTDRSKRPLISKLDDESLRRYVEEIMQERLPFYSQADIIFNPLKDDVEDLILRIEAKSGN